MRDDEFVERCIAESGICLIWSGRPRMINSVLEVLRQRRFNDIHLEIRLTKMSRCTMEVVNEFRGEGYVELSVVCVEMVINRGGFDEMA